MHAYMQTDTCIQAAAGVHVNREGGIHAYKQLHVCVCVGGGGLRTGEAQLLTDHSSVLLIEGGVTHRPPVTLIVHL